MNFEAKADITATINKQIFSASQTLLGFSFTLVGVNFQIGLAATFNLTLRGDLNMQGRFALIGHVTQEPMVILINNGNPDVKKPAISADFTRTIDLAGRANVTFDLGLGLKLSAQDYMHAGLYSSIYVNASIEANSTGLPVYTTATPAWSTIGSCAQPHHVRLDVDMGMSKLYFDAGFALFSYSKSYQADIWSGAKYNFLDACFYPVSTDSGANNASTQTKRIELLIERKAGQGELAPASKNDAAVVSAFESMLANHIAVKINTSTTRVQVIYISSNTFTDSSVAAGHSLDDSPYAFSTLATARNFSVVTANVRIIGADSSASTTDTATSSALHQQYATAIANQGSSFATTSLANYAVCLPLADTCASCMAASTASVSCSYCAATKSCYVTNAESGTCNAGFVTKAASCSATSGTGSDTDGTVPDNSQSGGSSGGSNSGTKASSSGGGVDMMIIIGAAVGGVALIIIIIVVLCCLCRRRRKVEDGAHLGVVEPNSKPAAAAANV